jgi:hypothetical protein
MGCETTPRVQRSPIDRRVALPPLLEAARLLAVARDQHVARRDALLQVPLSDRVRHRHRDDELGLVRVAGDHDVSARDRRGRVDLAVDRDVVRRAGQPVRHRRQDELEALDGLRILPG